MPTSGNINESVQFHVGGAGSITGVNFGEGLANFSIINTGIIEASVPQTASYGKVVFGKQNITEIFNVTATGNGDSAAYTALTGQINSLGYYVSASGCSTGVTTFTENNSASGVCVISATGSSVSSASGVMVSAHGSGFCGGPTGFSTGSYTVSQTRLSGISVNQLGVDNNYVALGLVEYTGNLGVKKAAVTVTCETSGRTSQTDYNFVPVSRINSFTVVPSGGGLITLSGNCFTSVTGVNLGAGQSLAFGGVSNTEISGQVPTGEFNDKIYLYLYSGLTVVSSQNYVTSGVVSGIDKSQTLSILPNQNLVANRGLVGSIIVNGSGMNNLTGVKFVSAQDVEINVSNFTGTSGQVTASINGLATGFHDIVLSKTGASATGENIVQILDSGSFSYSYETVLSSGFNYIGEQSSSSGLASILNSTTYAFEHAGEADRISVEFSGESINAGNITFSLNKKSSITKTVQSNYTIKANASASGASVTAAYDKFNSGIYTTSLYGAYDPSSSYEINDRVCDVNSESTSLNSVSTNFTSTGVHTGTVSGNPELSLALIGLLRNNDVSQYTTYVGQQSLSCVVNQSTGITSGVVGMTATGSGINISASGFSTSSNTVAINDMISSTGAYSGYVLISTSTGISDNFESYIYQSGITFPHSSSDLNNTNSQIWHNVFGSGIAILYPGGYAGEHGLTSGFAIITGSATGTTQLSFSGQSVSSVNNSISGEITNNRSQCTTGDPSHFVTGEVVNLYQTGYFYGYC